MEDDDGAPFFLADGQEGAAFKKEAASIMAQVAAMHAVPAPKVHHSTSAFLDGKRTLALGISAHGAFAMALRYAPTGQTTTPIHYARLMWMKDEQIIYETACRRRAAAQPDQVDLERTRLGLIRTIDPVLRKPIDKLLKEWEKIPRAESKAITTMSVMPRSKPARQFECAVTVLEAVPKEVQEEVLPSVWSLCLVELPRKAPRRETHLPGYKDVEGLSWQVSNECVPVIAFSESHVVAIYDHKRPEIGLVLDCATLQCTAATKKWTATRRWMCRAPAPPKPESPEGINYLVRLSEQGIIAWATGYSVWVTTIESALVATRVFHFESHVYLTSLALCDETRILTVGTSRGEVLSFNWETAADDSLDIMLTPHEEPVLAVFREAAAQGRNMALTISGVLGRLNPGSREFKALEMERPTAMAAAGDRVLVSNKYGKVEVYYPGRTDVPMRGLLDIPKEPPTILQIVWDGVWCNAQGEMAAQLYDGTVHFWE